MLKIDSANAESFAYSAMAQVFTTSVPVHRSRRRPAKAQ
jgi:hypothetical protein